MWEVREAGLGATAFIPGKPDTYEGWEDSAVPPERSATTCAPRKIAKKYDYDSALYGHYGKAACTRAGTSTCAASRHQKFRAFLDEASDLVLELGGSISGEHGDGESKAELLPKMFGPELIDGFREFKSIWDPEWKMNPGKVVDPYPITQKPAARAELCAAAAEDSLRVREGQRQLRARGGALRRDRQVPAHERRRDVPELHGHARGEAHDARPRANPLGDGQPQ
jgi:hypothetical protein